MSTAHPLADRFWKYTEKRGEDECWQWRSYRNTKGYARIGLLGGNRTMPASRVAWEISNGREWPKGQLALHRCDNPGCVNPAHIWPGSAQENASDCISKDRRPRALSAAQREEVRRIYRYNCAEFGSHALAKRYGVATSTILRILNGRSNTAAGQSHSLMKAWNRARPAVRQAFLQQIGVVA